MLAEVPKLGTNGIDDSNAARIKPSDWLQNYQFYLIGLTYLSSRLIYMVSMAYIVFYVEFTLLLEKKFNAVVPLVMYISGFVMSLVVEIVKKSIGRDIIFLISSILGLGENTSQCLYHIFRILSTYQPT